MEAFRGSTQCSPCIWLTFFFRGGEDIHFLRSSLRTSPFEQIYIHIYKRGSVELHCESETDCNNRNMLSPFVIGPKSSQNFDLLLNPFGFIHSWCATATSSMTTASSSDSGNAPLVSPSPIETGNSFAIVHRIKAELTWSQLVHAEIIGMQGCNVKKG